ncbi:MAG TPA: 3D domain-containing protein [Gemmatimonadaceae bacterium]|nr:3D domain-containing protein [Gemmatimonadaceae bacterium]
MNTRRFPPPASPEWRRLALVRTAVAALAAVGLLTGGVVPTPLTRTQLRYQPVVVVGEPVHRPVLVRAQRPLPRLIHAAERAAERAAEGQALRVSLTQYCLRGQTRRGRWVRPGIVAADPRVFPLARHVEVFLGGNYLGRFLVDDTGKNVLGNTLDIWTPNCREARRFGRQWGHAVLVARDAKQ